MLAQIAQGSASPGWVAGLPGASGTLAAGSVDVSAAAVAFAKLATCRCPNDNAKWMTSAISASPPPMRRFERNQPIQAQPVAIKASTSLAHGQNSANGLSGQNWRKINEIKRAQPGHLFASARRCFKPGPGEQLARSLCAHRLAEHVALRIFAAELIELDRVRIGLRPFRHHLHAEIVRERDDRAQDHRALTLGRGADGRLVELDGVERETLQLGQRG